VRNAASFAAQGGCDWSLYAVTLASIGDGVITTDGFGRVTFLNAEAEKLTGWKNAEARGKKLDEVFRIINEETRATVESPVEKVFRTGMVVGLANHTVLISKDGTERIIDDSGAPIRTADGKIMGVVLVFRDNTEKKTRRGRSPRQRGAITFRPGKHPHRRLGFESGESQRFPFNRTRAHFWLSRIVAGLDV
jgi:PAS domain S-box-containing protein